MRLHNDKIKDDLAIVDACQLATKGQMTFMVDANQATSLPSPKPGVRCDFQRALRMARELETRNVLWLEEPLSRYDFENLIRLREATEIKIAGGEKNQGLHEFRWLIERGVYDIIQPDCAMSEGVSQLRKVAAIGSPPQHEWDWFSRRAASDLYGARHFLVRNNVRAGNQNDRGIPEARRHS